MQVNSIALRDTQMPRRETRSKGYTGYVAVDKNGKIILSAKSRYTDSGTCHAQVRIYGEESFGCGYGRAGGYGYDKESSAMAEALEKAGVNVTGLSATGQTRQALEEVAKLINPDFLVLVATWH